MKLEIHYSDDWAALYVDGQLDRVGDSYLAEERVMELIGVTVVHDNAFMRGQHKRDGVAPTVEEVEQFRAQRETNRRTADELEAQAKELLEDAARLRGEKP